MTKKQHLITYKIKLLVYGVDCDFKKLSLFFKNSYKNYKINQIKISDRHFIKPKDERRNYIPDELILSENNKQSIVKTYYNPKSPFVLTTHSNNLVIYDKKRKLYWSIKIKPLKLPKFYRQKYQGLYLNEFVSIVGQDRISIVPFDGCEHWFTGRPCRFCGGNPARLGFNPQKPNLSQVSKIGNYTCWWNHNKEFVKKHIARGLQALLKYDKPKPHIHIMLMTGSLENGFEWKIIFDILPIVKKYINLSKVDSYLILMPPQNFKLIDKSKKAGFRNISYNLECFDKKRFKKVCPGKEKLYGYDKMIKALKYSVKVFGKGNVRTNFVLGSESIDKTLNGVKTLAKQGIVSDYSVFFPRPGSV